MPRADLLALTPDDLATLTNRGTVKRAQRELEANDVTCEIAVGDDGELIFTWSDGITCRFPHGKTVHEAVCSSGSLGISRHVVRSVLAYQSAQASSGGSSVSSMSTPLETVSDAETTAATPVATDAPARKDSWDPGALTDHELVTCFRTAAVAKARRRFEQGVLVELTRGAKPTARFLDDACTVRFMVPGDLRYATADCAPALLATWVTLAVWSFRHLASDQLGGMVCLGHTDLPIQRATLADVNDLMDEALRDGFSGLAASWSPRLTRVEQSLRDEGLVWPAEIVAELLQQKEMYDNHDARFEPQEVLHLLGELTARSRSIAGGSRAVPQLLVRGAKSDRPTEISGGRMIGVGLGVRPSKRHATLSVYLQDADSGSVAAIERIFADPDAQSGDAPRPFSQLAATTVHRGVSLIGMAASQLLLKSGKRTPGGLLVLPRTAGSLSIHPQSYQWEQLKPPFAADSFAQLAVRFAKLPPSYLRPRRRTENLHVVAITAVEGASFDIARQRLTAQLRDAHNGTALLVQPFHYRGSDGFDEFLSKLQERGAEARFVCGHVRTAGRTLEIHPICVVFGDGQHRIGINPWVASKTVADAGEPSPSSVAFASAPPGQQFLEALHDSLSEMLLTGARNCSSAPMAELADLGRRLGFSRLIDPIAKLVDGLAARSNSVRWDPAIAVRHARQLCLLSRVAMD